MDLYVVEYVRTLPRITHGNDRSMTMMGGGRTTVEDMVEAGEVVRISGGVYAASDRLSAMKRRLREHFQEHPQLTASQARELLETNRKYIIPFLEYLDSVGFTRRQGDVRALVSR